MCSVAFVLEEVEVPQPLGLGVMDPMQPFDPRCGKPAAGDKVDTDRQHLACGVEINAAHVPRFGDAEGGFKQLVLHPQSLASIAECRTMPAFSKAPLSGPVVAVKGSLRRASPALDRAHRRLLSSPHPLGFQKRLKYVHWNMRNSNYGFAAMEHRYRVLGGYPVIISDDKKIDLARILIDIQGRGYIEHPRLESLMVKNSIMFLDFLKGAQEAEAFEARNFVALHQSTLRKVDVLANIATLSHDRHLETNTNWWQMHGGSVRAMCNWIAENKLVTLTISIISLGIGIAGVLLIR